jgi:hypothetical protein
MAIGIEKILADSATEWHKRTETDPKDYIGKGIHVNSSTINESRLLEEFANKVPSEASVVVNYKIKGNNTCLYAYGTALIPANTRQE